MQKPTTIHTVDEIKVLKIRGPWASKSGGNLNVLFNLPQDELEAFLDYQNPEFDKMPGNMRGFRSYKVSEVPKDSIGAKECHLARNELVFAAKGSFTWKCVDLLGGEREFTLDGNTAVLTPFGLFHVYQALEDDSTIQVICNTGFDPENPATHDSYSEAEFYELQAQVLAENKQ